MRYVLRNHNEVAHYWMHKTQDSGRASNMFFRDSTIYSWGEHFAIARHTPEGAILFTTRDYSVSTRMHKTIVRRAIGFDNPNVILCLDVRANNPARHTVNLQSMLAEIGHLREKMQRARKNKGHYAGCILELTNNHNRYVEAFGIGEQLTDSEAATALFHQYRRDEEERLARIVRERDENAAQSMARWVAGESDHAPHTSDIRLRVKGDAIETSWGASIPIGHALTLWYALPTLRGINMRHAARSFHLGVYKLDEVTPERNIIAGCHRIAFAEMQRIATLLNLPADNPNKVRILREVS